LGVGEALVSFLDEKGRPMPVERAFICPPMSRIGPATDAERSQIIRSSALFGHYENAVDRESAYEILKGRTAEATVATESSGFDWGGMFGGSKGESKPGRQPDSIFEAAVKSTARTIGSELGRRLVRGVLGSLLGGRK
jgi:hypothetical protein